VSRQNGLYVICLVALFFGLSIGRATAPVPSVELTLTQADLPVHEVVVTVHPEDFSLFTPEAQIASLGSYASLTPGEKDAIDQFRSSRAPLESFVQDFEQSILERHLEEQQFITQHAREVCEDLEPEIRRLSNDLHLLMEAERNGVSSMIELSNSWSSPHPSRIEQVRYELSLLHIRFEDNLNTLIELSEVDLEQFQDLVNPFEAQNGVEDITDQADPGPQ
jgi:hypothetical protein